MRGTKQPIEAHVGYDLVADDVLHVPMSALRRRLGGTLATDPIRHLRGIHIRAGIALDTRAQHSLWMSNRPSRVFRRYG